MNSCPCCSNLVYSTCCEPYLLGTKRPSTPEALMRSRYTAYSKTNMAYIEKTMQGKPLIDFHPEAVVHWARSVQWLGLRVIKAYADLTSLEFGFVEFIATYRSNGFIKTMHELSRFQCIDGQWFYIDGELIPSAPTKSSPNAPCHCGSGKKFKRCCGRN